MTGPLLESLEKFATHHHVTLLHQDAEDRLASLVPFLRIGLGRREKCLLYCDPSTGDGILSGLRERGVDVGGALARGAILITRLGAGGRRKTAFHPDDLVSFFRKAARQARSERYSSLRICLDVAFALRGERRRERILDFQGKMHSFLAASDSLALCMHGMEDLPAEILLDALRSHPFVLWQGRAIENLYFVHPSPDPSELTSSRELRERLDLLAERHDQISRIRRQSLRLRHLQDVTVSLLGHAAVPDLLKGIVEGVISFGYQMCWIGMARPDGSVEPVASWGDKRRYLDEVRSRWDESPLGNGPVGNAIRNGRPEVIRDVLRSRRFAPWRESAISRGFLSVASVPLTEAGRPVGALVVYANVRDAFDREAVEELAAVALQASLVLQHAKKFRKLSLSEERFRRLFDQIPAACYTFDRDGIIRHWNRHCRALYGYSPKEAVGKPLDSLIIRPEDRETAEKIRNRIFAGESLPAREREDRCADGGTRWLLSNVFPYRGVTEEVEFGISVNVDITDRQKMEEEKERLGRELAQAKKMQAMGSFAREIAHDYHNILETILEQTSLLQERMEPDSPFRETAGKIEESVEQAAWLTTKLLGFARDGKHRVELLSLNNVVEDVVADISRSFDRSIEIRTDLDPSLRAVDGDREQIRHSLLNLCLNARDAMPSGGTLSLRTRNAVLSAGEAKRYHVAGPGAYAALSVTDTGEGMTDEAMRRLFEPFFTTKRDKGRSGMGLPMVYGIVKNHGGGIHVESAPGKGASFTIHLPERSS